jgi:NAD(P)-dependent dehydrogenase (short-subunit alcohol dehydrogenase family)
MDELAGKTAVVTGAASGMGRAFANRFAAAGMNIVLADMAEGPLAEAVAEIAASGVRAMGVRTDVSQGDQMDALAARAIGEFGRVHVVCNNAGVAGRFQGVDKVDASEWEWVLGVNLWGVIHGHRVFLPHLLEHGDGHIVNTASMAGHLPSHSAYGASKWAVVGITEGLYLQLQAEGSTVGVSCLCPGFVATNIATSMLDRPEWVSPGPHLERTAADEAAHARVTELVQGGLPPEHVADMVHDAVLAQKFWIFPHVGEFDYFLQPRFAHVLNGTNPNRPIR